jgi:hypothetical protein
MQIPSHDQESTPAHNLLESQNCSDRGDCGFVLADDSGAMSNWHVGWLIEYSFRGTRLNSITGYSHEKRFGCSGICISKSDYFLKNV